MNLICWENTSSTHKQMYKISWIVIHGDKKGRTLGFPTINLNFSWNLDEATYALNVEYNNKIYKALGTFLKEKRRFEAHILDFDFDIYGQNVDIYILGKLRENKKFWNWEELKEQIQKDLVVRKKSKYTVLTFGSFDHLHAGHIYYLSQAKKYGDILITIVASDENIHKIKGHSPRYPQNERITTLENILITDKVIAGVNTNPLKWIQQFSPNSICLGYDQKWPFLEKLDDEIKRLWLQIQILRISSHCPEKYKSSLLK